MEKSIIKTELIDEFLKKENISKTKFCRMCKIQPNVLKKIYANDCDYPIIALFKIAYILNLETKDIFNE